MSRTLLVCALLTQPVPQAARADPKDVALHGSAVAQQAFQAHPLFGVLGDTPAWRSYKRRFIDEGGRVVDTGNGHVSHSEGQGYGMLLAIAAGDLDTFRLLWTWTRTKLMVRQDSLIAWRWIPGERVPVGDLNDAADGDLLVAWALAEAAAAWPDQGFGRDARRIAMDVGRQAALWKTRGGPLLLPGVVGFSAAERKGGPIVNLSYWVFPAFPRLAAVAPRFDWARLGASGLALLRQARFGSTQLPTDWIAMGGDKPQPAPGFPATFSYNAIRIPLYLALAGDTDRADYAPFARAWEQTTTGKLPIVDVATGRLEGWMAEPGYAAVAALTLCAARGTALPASFSTPSDTENYYPATLHLIALVAAQESYAACLGH